jgi:Tol biopolymer transport system component
MDIDGTHQRMVVENACSAHWSPDGTRIASFRCPLYDEPWDSTLRIVNLDGVEEQTLDLGAWDFAWSPAGDRIAYTLYDEQMRPNIYVVDFNGGEPVQLTFDGAYQPVWSPDGSRIAYTGGIETGTAKAHVRVMDADGSHNRRLACEYESCSEPTWAPDGSRLAYMATSWDTPYPSPIVVGTVSGNATRIIAYGITPVWSPVDDRILFGSMEADGDSWGISIVDADTGTQQQVGDFWPGIWSPDGRQILYAGDTGVSPNDPELGTLGQMSTYTIPAGGGEAIELTMLRPPQEGAWDCWSQPIWSPDGGTLAVVGRVGEEMLTDVIYLFDSDGSNARRLVAGTAPQWSPDGTRLLFYEPPPNEGGRPASHFMYVIKIDTGAVTELGHGYDAAWSPDGTRIAFAGPGPADRSSLIVMDPDGANRVTMLTEPLGIMHLAWSPDGTRIAFVSRRERDTDIFTVYANGTDLVNLTHDIDVDDEPAWSPDGSWIAFLSNRGGPHEIWIMRPDGTNVYRVTHGTGGTPTWSPGSTLLAFTSYSDSELWVVRLDGNGLRRLTDAGGLDPAWEPVRR